ncbi:hypothetical protein C173_13740 [Paenibacillus sp. FSL R7-277]|nr:hypothetical protein C173_13740 [Paenibacillus sp. FSL R7-277]
MTPSELEGRLRKALEQAPVRRKSRAGGTRTWAATAAAAMLLTVGVYQYPALAYYGGKLFNQTDLYTLGFSGVAEHGYGQTINKSITLENGIVFTINGVIADDNALLMYYSIDLPPGGFDEEPASLYALSRITGFLTDSSPTSGGGGYNSDKTRYEGINKFEPVSPFARSLTLTLYSYQAEDKPAQSKLSFNFDASRAMKSILVADIHQAVPVDQGTVYYDTITASPTSTIVKGHYKMDNGENPRFSAVTKLYVNGTEMNSRSMRGTNSSKKGTPEFIIEYDVLPTDKLQSVELVLDNFSGYQKVGQPIPLASPSDHSVTVGEEKLWIRSVSRTADGYDIVVAGKQFTMLDKDTLAVQAGGAAVPVSSISDSRPWDLKNGNILWERTYSFQTTEKPEFLEMDGFHYIKFYRHTIPVPLGGK